MTTKAKRRKVAGVRVLSVNGEVIAVSEDGDIEIRLRPADKYPGAVTIDAHVNPTDGIATDRATLTLHRHDLVAFLLVLTAAVRELEVSHG